MRPAQAGARERREFGRAHHGCVWCVWAREGVRPCVRNVRECLRAPPGLLGGCEGSAVRPPHGPNPSSSSRDRKQRYRAVGQARRPAEPGAGGIRGTSGCVDPTSHVALSNRCRDPMCVRARPDNITHHQCAPCRTVYMAIHDVVTVAWVVAAVACVLGCGIRVRHDAPALLPRHDASCASQYQELEQGRLVHRYAIRTSPTTPACMSSRSCT